MEMQHKEVSSPPLPRSQKGKENTPHSGRKSSAASKPPSAIQSQKGRTSQSAKVPKTVPLEANDSPLMEKTEGRKLKGENSPSPTSTPKSTKKERQGADDTTKTADTGEKNIDGKIHPPNHTTFPSESTNSVREEARGARSKHCVPLSLKEPEETADHEPEVCSKLQRQRRIESAGNNHEVSTVSTSTMKKQGTQRKPKLSTPSTSTSLEEVACEKREISSVPTSTTKRRAKDKHPSSTSQSLEKTAEDGCQSLSSSTLQKEEETQVSSTLKKKGTGARSKPVSNSTSTSLETNFNEENESLSELTSPKSKRRESGARDRLSSPPTSTNHEDITGEEHKVSSASTSTLKKQGTRGKSSPLITETPAQMSNEELEVSSKLTSPLNRAEDAKGKSSPPTSAIHYSSPLTSKSQEESAGNNLEVSTVSTSTFKKQGTQRKPKLSTPSTSTSLEEVECEKREISSLPTSTTKRRAKDKHPSSTSQSLEKTAEDGCQSLSSSTLQKEEETQVSSTLKEKGTGARSKPVSNSTSTILETNFNKENESLSELTSTKSKRRESGARDRLSSPPTSTNHEDITGEEHKVFSASTSTLKKQGTRGKSSPLITKTPDQMSNEELEVSSELTSSLNRAAEAKGKSSPPTSTVHYHTAGKEQEVSPALASALKTGSEESSTRFSSVTSSSTSTLKRGERKGKGKSSPSISKSGEETADEGLQFSSGCMSTLQEKDGGDERKYSKTVKQGEGAPVRMSSVPAAEKQEETERQIISPSTLTELKEPKETALLTRKPKTSKKKINDSREMKLIKEADEVMEKALIVVSANPTRNGNDFFDEEVKLEKKEKLQASSNWQMLCKEILESLNEGSSWTWKVLNSGSSYDGTKVARADEVDCMFFPKNIDDNWMEIDTCGAPPEFCFIKLRDLPISNHKYLALKELCGDQGMIKSSLFRSKAFELFTKGVAKNRHAKAGQPSATGAAFPVDYNAIPTETQGLISISLDLVPALHFSTWPEMLKGFFSKLPHEKREDVEKVGFHAVPKQCLDDNADCLWRLSFSAAEKQMTNFVDGKDRDPSSEVVTTYRKHVMRMVKRIMEICKGIDNSKKRRPCSSVQELNKAVTTLRKQREGEIKCFSTFQIRMLFWDDFYVRLPADVHWERTTWRTRLQETFRNLRKMLTGDKQVEHFFVPGLNTMETVPIEEREFLYILFYIAEKIF